jgi:hypothetical protein
VLGALQVEYRNGRSFALKALLLGPAVLLLGLGGVAARNDLNANSARA